MTKINDGILEVLGRYFQQTMNRKDELLLKQWLEEDEENRRKLEFLEELRQSGEDESDKRFFRNLDIEEDWASIVSHIRREKGQANVSSAAGYKKEKIQNHLQKRKRQHAFTGLLKVAALLLIAFIPVYITLQFLNEPGGGEENREHLAVPKEIATERGERANITLGDGTRVSLSVDSKLLIPQNFSKKERRVILEGEAFFDVARDSERPFFIEAGGSVTEVLGTSFGVRSYEGDTVVRVVVKTGTVALRTIKKDDASVRLSSGNITGSSSEPGTVILETGEIGHFTKEDYSISSGIAENPDDYFGWLQNRLVFRQTPLEEVMETLERWYDVTITLDPNNREMEEFRLTVNMRKGHIRDVLELLRESVGIEYDLIEEDHIVLFKN